MASERRMCDSGRWRKLPEVWECTCTLLRWYREQPAQKSFRRLEYINTRKSWFALNLFTCIKRGAWMWCPEVRGATCKFKLIKLITAHTPLTRMRRLNWTVHVVVFSNMFLILGDIVGSADHSHEELHTSTSPGSSLATLHLWSNTLWIRRREERERFNHQIMQIITR